jgi:ankyrin repeat protein
VLNLLSYYFQTSLLIPSVVQMPGVDLNNQDDQGSTALMCCSFLGYRIAVKALISAGANTEICDIDEGATALMMACHGGDLKIVNDLIAAGADLNAKTKNGKTVLMRAVEKSTPEIVRELLVKGADYTVKDSNANTAEDLAPYEEFRAILRAARERDMLSAVPGLVSPPSSVSSVVSRRSRKI